MDFIGGNYSIYTIITKILPYLALEEYSSLLWEEIIKFVERHPELNNQFAQVFSMLDYNNPRKTLNEWLNIRKTSGTLGSMSFLIIIGRIARAIGFYPKIGNYGLDTAVLRQLFLNNPQYVKLMLYDIDNKINICQSNTNR